MNKTAEEVRYEFKSDKSWECRGELRIQVTQSLIVFDLTKEELRIIDTSIECCRNVFARTFY